MKHYKSKRRLQAFKPYEATPTKNPMWFYWELSGADGAWFCLLPEAKHTVEDFKEALSYIKRERDVTGWAWNYLEDATARYEKALKEYEQWKGGKQ